MKLIGINGFKRSGKDTAYRLISESITSDRPQDRVERRAFADKLKVLAALSLGFAGDDEYLIGKMGQAKEHWDIEAWQDSIKRNHSTITGRGYLQNMGANARDLFGEGFWVDQVLPENRVEFEKVWRTIGRNGEIAGLPAIGCVTDVRYPNEAERVLALGGTVLEIVRPGTESDGHSTEIPLPRELVTVTINNNSTLEEFAKNLDFVLENV